jgi:hypothetical protein
MPSVSLDSAEPPRNESSVMQGQGVCSKKSRTSQVAVCGVAPPDGTGEREKEKEKEREPETALLSTFTEK